MKKLICTLFITLFTFFACLGFTSCKKEIADVKSDDEYLGTSDENLKVEGMSAFDLFNEAYANWLVDDGYLREETLNFTVSSAFGVMGTRVVQMMRKIDGDRIFNQEITKGSGVTSDMTSAIRYYFDGENGYELTNKEEKNLDLSGDVFKVNDWGEFGHFNGDVKEKNYLLRERWTIYELKDRKSLASNHNDSVYKAGNTYYFTLIFDCSSEAIKVYQPVLLSEYSNNMEAPENTFKMENTVIDVAVREIDGKMKFTAWYRSETYSGKARKILETTCKETCYNKMTYSDNAITKEELLNLA